MSLHADVFIPTLSKFSSNPSHDPLTLPPVSAVRSISWFQRDAKERKKERKARFRSNPVRCTRIERSNPVGGGLAGELGWICADSVSAEKFRSSSRRRKRRCRAAIYRGRTQGTSAERCGVYAALSSLYPPWLHGLHTRATVAAVPRSRLSSCALHRYIPICVCTYVRTYTSCAGCTPTCPRRRVLVRVCSERERERVDRGELEGWRETDREGGDR